MAGTGIAAVTIASQTAQDRTAYCFSNADIASPSTQVTLADEVAESHGPAMPVPADPDRAAHAIDMCGAVWRIGLFASDGMPVDDGRQHNVPPLTACLRADQVIAVFPGDDQQLYESVGLPPAP